MRNLSCKLRERIVRVFYLPHHARLNEAVNMQLEKHGNALIVDCHSFTDTPFNRDLDKTPNRPDICIGTDSYRTHKELVELTVSYFESNGLSVGINTPYAGTIVPLEYYGKDNRVQSIMVEVNRKLYLNLGENTKSKNYDGVKNVVQGYIQKLRLFELVYQKRV